jgi:hypothetical protein
MKVTKFNLFLGGCVRWIVTTGLVISVLRLHATNDAIPKGSIPIKFHVWVSYENLSRHADLG